MFTIARFRSRAFAVTSPSVDSVPGQGARNNPNLEDQSSEEADGHVIGPGELFELDEVDPPLAQLALRDVGLWLIECLRGHGLREACLLSSLSQPEAECGICFLIGGGVQGNPSS